MSQFPQNKALSLSQNISGEELHKSTIIIIIIIHYCYYQYYYYYYFPDIEFNISREELHNHIPAAYRSHRKPTGWHGETIFPSFASF